MKEYDVNLHTLVVDVQSGAFLRIASKAGFDFDRGQWITRGRMDQPGYATVINTDKWSGVRGTATIGCYHTGTEGGYAGHYPTTDCRAHDQLRGISDGVRKVPFVLFWQE